MIQLSRLDGKEYFLNPHQIESMESMPDTTLRLLSGKSVVVLEKPSVVIERIISYRRQIGAFGNED